MTTFRKVSCFHVGIAPLEEMVASAASLWRRDATRSASRQPPSYPQMASGPRGHVEADAGACEMMPLQVLEDTLTRFVH